MKPHLMHPQASCAANGGPKLTHRGETLVGLMVGMGIGLLVLAAGAKMLAQHLQGHRWALQDSHLHHDLRSALDALARELRQAQSVGQAWQARSTADCQDPFCSGASDIKIQGSRIDFSRDRNQNGLLDNNECSGFRLKDAEVQVRTSCAPEVWTDLTDAGSLKMVDMQWQLHCERRGRWVHRWVTVQLNAEWPHDASRQLSLSQTVSLRNDVPALPWPAACGAAP